ncbi:MAG TPA: hypothetical protein VKQ32_09610 [Polyangia bacterium]|nr:hypothetical protein [Polyangia bacterium]
MTSEDEAGGPWAIVYLWRGERHRHGRLCATWQQAQALCHEVRMAGFRAWIERN